MTKLVLKTTRYTKKIKKIVKIVAFRGNSGNSGGDGGGDRVLNSNHRGTAQGKTAGDLGERVPRVPLGIPSLIIILGPNHFLLLLFDMHQFQEKKKINKKKGQFFMNKLRVATFHHLIIIGGAAVFSHYSAISGWTCLSTNLHVKLWELVAKISADTLSSRNSFSLLSLGHTV